MSTPEVTTLPAPVPAAEALWVCTAYDDGGFYVEGQSPVHGWFCMELETPIDLVRELRELRISSLLTAAEPGPHVIACRTCSTPWVCLCSPGTDDVAGCLFDQGECDDCAWARLMAADDAEEALEANLGGGVQSTEILTDLPEGSPAFGCGFICDR